jgi:hypothetical protein
LQILVSPACVCEHAAQRADRKRVAQGMIGHNHAAGVGAPVDSMTSSDALKDEPIGFQGSDELPS